MTDHIFGLLKRTAGIVSLSTCGTHLFRCDFWGRVVPKVVNLTYYDPWNYKKLNMWWDTSSAARRVERAICVLKAVRVICRWLCSSGRTNRTENRTVQSTHTHTHSRANKHPHTPQGPMGKKHHTWSQGSRQCKQQLLISVKLLFNFLFVPNWNCEGTVFFPPTVPWY